MKQPQGKRTPVIFDTDMGNDVDDALALAVLHSLESRGQCKILACTMTRNDPKSALYTDAVNHFYGRPRIPIGVIRHTKLADPSPFVGAHVQFKTAVNPDTAPEAVELIRKTLKSQPDGSVVLIQVGFFSNFARMAANPEDRALIARKVKFLSVMAGAFTSIDGNAHFTEYNVTQDVPSAQTLTDQWPTPIVWGGFEIGWALRYPLTSIAQDFSYVEKHPIPIAYKLYCQPKEERPCWDLASCLYAVLPDRPEYFTLSEAGQVSVEKDGFTRFTPKPNGRDRYLKMDIKQTARTLEALVGLTSQPPG